MAMDQAFPEAYRALLGLERANRSGPLEASLYELVKIRASQLNGCAFCLNMHLSDARAAGESQQRLDVLSAWREVDGLYSPRERAALALTEAVTLISHEGVPDEVWDATREVFDERETAALIAAIATINVWNRIAITTRQQPAPAQQASAQQASAQHASV
jgi:AhpD family alkylhydroperoxidase